ncbi:FUSC family protein [Neobacillus ginsengisoli]|uniref:Uncharacterized membrane protein YgaE (UPF0421/DUF939 family) n=1 Tax=Neobacillus ginsengisoli TaxID=904295 RepID=A0ABT9XVT3_9BACI|nr:FUSC family protein [Neobacillus ginsengisoli]MDQ0199683.1 uncharacterized membrane protein YgaE (UPF0421/DUF939 family) [Neobacillus ginsengisoli]
MKKNNQLKKQMENKTILIWKIAIASALSWEIARLAGSHHPYLAPISVILCLQTTVNSSIRFSYHRMVGTIIGIAVVVLLAPQLKVNGWTLGLLILIGSFIAKWLKRDETAIHQVALTVLLVFVMGHKSGEYPIDRFRDTLIGAIIAVLIHMLLSPPNFTKQASKSIQHFCTHLTKTFNQVSEWVQSGLEKNEGYNLQIETKKLLQELHQVKNYIMDATDSLKYNPWATRSEKELQECKQRIYFLTQGYSYLSSIVDILMSWSNAGTMTPFQQTQWAKQLKALSPFFYTKKTRQSLIRQVKHYWCPLKRNSRNNNFKSLYIMKPLVY